MRLMFKSLHMFAKVWFKNRRAKYRKKQKALRHEQLPQATSSGGAESKADESDGSKSGSEQGDDENGDDESGVVEEAGGSGGNMDDGNKEDGAAGEYISHVVDL
jgi:hypothetical protein